VPTLKIHKARDAARDQVRHALEVLDFLGDVEAVEEHQRRYCAGAPRQWFRVHENSGKRSALVRYLNVLDARPPHELRRVAEAFDAAAIRIEPLGLRLQEALADVVVVGRAQEIGRGARAPALGEQPAAGCFDRAGLARPFAEPRGVVAQVRAQTQSNAVNFTDLGPAPGALS